MNLQFVCYFIDDGPQMSNRVLMLWNTLRVQRTSYLHQMNKALYFVRSKPEFEIVPRHPLARGIPRSIHFVLFVSLLK